MPRIVLTGWKAGFRKVDCTRLLQTELGYSLSAAKQVTDTLLDGKTVQLDLPRENLEPIMRELESIGVTLHEEG